MNFSELVLLPWEKEHSREFKLLVYGKRQTSYSSWKFLKKENEPIKTAHKILMDKKLVETTNSCVEIWWIVGDKQRENLVTWYKSRLPFDLNVMLNLPSIKPQVTVVQASCHLPTCILMSALIAVWRSVPRTVRQFSERDCCGSRNVPIP